MEAQQPLGFASALACNDIDDAIDQRCCVPIEERLQQLDQSLCIWTTEPEAMQDTALCSLCSPPLVLIDCCQTTVQPGKHRVQQLLLPLEKFCPDLRWQATYELHPLWRRRRGYPRVVGAVLGQVEWSIPCLAAAFCQLFWGCDGKL